MPTSRPLLTPLSHADVEGGVLPPFEVQLFASLLFVEVFLTSPILRFRVRE